MRYEGLGQRHERVLAVAAIEFRTCRTRELFCYNVYGAGRLLPAAVDECDAFEDFGELSDVFGSFGAAAKQVLWEPSLHFPVDEPEAHDSS